jgi:hypothetical protein
MRRNRSKKNSDISDLSANILTKVCTAIHSGSVKIEVDKSQAAAFSVQEHGKKISLDLTEPDLLLRLRDENNEKVSIFDKLRIAKDFAHKLADMGITLSVLRHGKEAITLGKEAKPTLSRIITRSGDIQVDSVLQSSKLRGELESD